MSFRGTKFFLFAYKLIILGAFVVPAWATAAEVAKTSHLTSGVRFSVVDESSDQRSLLRMLGTGIRNQYTIYRRNEGGNETRAVNEELLATLFLDRLVHHPSVLSVETFNDRYGSPEKFMLTAKLALVDYLDPRSVVLTAEDVEAYLQSTQSAEGARAALSDFKAGKWTELYNIFSVYSERLEGYRRRSFYSPGMERLGEAVNALNAIPKTNERPARAANEEGLPNNILADLKIKLDNALLRQGDLNDAVELAILEQHRDVESFAAEDVGAKNRSAVFASLIGSMDAFSNFIFGQNAQHLYRNSFKDSLMFGLQMSLALEGVKIMQVIPGSPAEKAGVKAGDIVTNFDGQRLLEPTAFQMSLIGPQKDVVHKLRIWRENKFLELSIQGMPLPPEVRGTVIEAGTMRLGYIEISQFSKATGERFRAELNRQMALGIDGLILNLKDNGGGIMEQAIEVLYTVLGSGEFVSTVEVSGSGRPKIRPLARSFLVGKPPLFLGPMVVQINGNSASASELVASSLKKANRALILGTCSFGKGCGQAVRTLDYTTFIQKNTGAYFKIQNPGVSYAAVSEFYFVDGAGQSPERVGVAPHVVLPNAPDAPVARIKDPEFEKRRLPEFSISLGTNNHSLDSWLSDDQMTVLSNTVQKMIAESPHEEPFVADGISVSEEAVAALALFVHGAPFIGFAPPQKRKTFMEQVLLCADYLTNKSGR